MALPTSGNLSFSQIKAEFGNAPSGPTTLRTYMRYPSGIVPFYMPENQNVPNWGSISMRQLLGARAKYGTIAKNADAYAYVANGYDGAPEAQDVYSNTVSLSGTSLTSVYWEPIMGGDYIQMTNPTGLSSQFYALCTTGYVTQGLFRAHGNNGQMIDVSVYLEYYVPTGTIYKSGDAYGFFEYDDWYPPYEYEVYSNQVSVWGSGISSVSWQMISGNTSMIGVSNPNGASTYFYAMVPANDTITAVMRGTANTGKMIDVNVSLSYSAPYA